MRHAVFIIFMNNIIDLITVINICEYRKFYKKPAVPAFGSKMVIKLSPKL